MEDILEIEAPVQTKNLWANDTWFTDNPGKILGEAYETSGRFGKVIKYKGSIDLVNNIEVPDHFIGNAKAENDPLLSVTENRNANYDSLEPGMQDKIKKIVEHSEIEVEKKLIKKVRAKKKTETNTGKSNQPREIAEVQSFEEVYKNYNPGISLKETEVFIWWKSHTNKPLSRRWVNLVAPGSYSQDSLFIPTAEFYNVPDTKIRGWVEEGLLFYVNGGYEPASIYLSGNVYEKKSQLQREKDDIVEKYGQTVYDNQLAAFDKAFATKYENRLTITGRNEDGLVLLPTSKFAEKFQISGLQMMADDAKFKIKTKTVKGVSKLDFENDANVREWKKDEFETLSLKHAFEDWLLKRTPKAFSFLLWEFLLT